MQRRPRGLRGLVLNEPGLVVVVNGRAHRLRAIALTETGGHLPVWLVDVDGAQGSAGTLETALLMAARAASVAPPKEA